MAANGTSFSVIWAMRVMPPMRTRPASSATTAPMTGSGTPKVAFTLPASELACTLAPIPKDARKPKAANSIASQVLPRPREM